MTNTGHSALHLAVDQGYTRIVERLVGFGIDLDLQDSDGDTALHIALSKPSADVLSAETPQLKKVQGYTLVVSSLPGPLPPSPPPPLPPHNHYDHVV